MSWSTVEEMLGSLDTTTTTPHQQQVNLWQHAMSSGKERSSSSTTGGSNKRKMGNAESCGDYYCSDVANIKKMKGGEQTVSSMNKKMKMKNNKSGKDEENCSEDWKNNFIHVRARRGQATDSHSLAERVRREKISERMKYLQDLVPGCDRITGKAGMLDEIINYVQSLQSQVEFLSMKLATVNPNVPDFNGNTSFMMSSGGDDTTVCGRGSGLIDTSYLGVNPVDLQQHMLQVSDSFTNTFLDTIIPSPYDGYHHVDQHQNPHLQGIIAGGYQNLKLET